MLLLLNSVYGLMA